MSLLEDINRIFDGRDRRKFEHQVDLLTSLLDLKSNTASLRLATIAM